MRVAVEGCCHGELDNIYATIQEAQASDGTPVDLLLICGDFQAIRNPSDLLSLAVPEKYRQLGGFYKYYSGEKVAPILTIVIGGNHEASNYMWELFHGGWLAPNIYYLGAAGSVLVNGVRISGASGIYKSHDYRKGRFESLPYDRSTIRSTYHTREFDVGRLSQLPLVSAWPTIVLSHDWPLEIERYGDTAGLVRRKPFFKEEIDSNTLGSPPLRGLLEVVKPTYWFAAHLHVKFAALFKHNKEPTTVKRQARPNHAAQPSQPKEANPEELAIDLDDDEAETSAKATGEKDDMEDFLAELERKEAELTKAQAVTTNPDELDIVDDEDEDPIHPEHPQPGLTDTISTNGIDESVSTIEQKAGNPDEIAMDDLLDEETTEEAVATTVTKPEIPSSSDKTVNVEAAATRFLALSKCLPGQDFLQILDIPTPSTYSSPSPPRMTYDPAWLAITRAYQPLLSISVHQRPLPTDATIAKATIEKELAWIRENVPNRGEVEITEVQQFKQTAPCPGQPGGDGRGPGPWYTNPQTEAFCSMLGLENKVNPVPAEMRQPKP